MMHGTMNVKKKTLHVSDRFTVPSQGVFHPLLVPWSRKSTAIVYVPYGSYGLYRASVPVQGCNLLFTLSGVLILYSQQLVFVIIIMLTSASEVRMEMTSLADGNILSMTNTYCCEYSIKTPDNGQ